MQLRQPNKIEMRPPFAYSRPLKFMNKLTSNHPTNIAEVIQCKG